MGDLLFCDTLKVKAEHSNLLCNKIPKMFMCVFKWMDNIQTKVKIQTRQTFFSVSKIDNIFVQKITAMKYEFVTHHVLNNTKSYQIFQ